MVCQSSSTPAPDLSVQAISVVSNNIQVTFQNTGNAPVTDDFWVDLYVNPNPVPTRVNQIWQQIAPYGAVWGVLGSLTPLNPGETLTLNIGDAYYWSSLSNLPSTLPTGTQLFAHADSYNPATSYGTVLERDELGCGVSYNNIGSTQLTTSVAPARVMQRQPASSNRLPKR